MNAPQAPSRITSMQDEPSTPRLAPIERPRSLLARLAYWMIRRRFGKVITPVKVVNARIPSSFRFSYELVKLEEKGLSLDASLMLLLKRHVAWLNGCSFCVDIAEAIGRQEGISVEKIRFMGASPTSPTFTPREQAALAYVEEATTQKRVSDETFDALRAHFTDREIVEITWLNAVENYYNLINLPLGIGSDGLCTLVEGRSYT